ncbi:cobyrinate a,c-diamide synthase [Shewanella sp. TC10]|uniref:cobyrinate a,c-diamide synthase n=1 Tax=Shewanella sp. TC10 TaxID=1419739 RepID=UPI00129E56CE|nr:cobyrinate a,c-diamide synthase [Shewanella sp. TC10]
MTNSNHQANSYSCPALFITAPQSDSGKTTIVAALARYWRNKKKRVRVFKTGPDFIDPMFHEVASGYPAYQLDIGMMGLEHCKQHLYKAAAQADLILVEGVMGMYDGHSSSANLAQQLGIPMLAVLPAAKMAQTFGAIAYGLAHYQPDVNLFGVVANQVGSAGHAKLLQQSLPEGIEFCGALMRDKALELPDRHLGLVQANEIPELDAWLDNAANLLGESCPMPLPEPVTFDYVAPENNEPLLEQTPMLVGTKIAVAWDTAFAFVYRDNLNFLEQQGAELHCFSPLTQALPECDALYLPGGYPELHSDALKSNIELTAQIKQHVSDNKPVVAECGGMLYLLESLTDHKGKKTPMLGILPGHCQMHDKLQSIGILAAQLSLEDNVSHHNSVPTTQVLKGHCFHYSSTELELKPFVYATHIGGRPASEAVYRYQNVTASYVHWFFYSAPQVICQWFKPTSYSS